MDDKKMLRTEKTLRKGHKKNTSAVSAVNQQQQTSPHGSNSWQTSHF